MKFLTLIIPLLIFLSCSGEHEYSHLEDNWEGFHKCKGYVQNHETFAVIETIPYSNDISLNIQNQYFKGKFRMEEILYNRFKFSSYPIDMELQVVNNDSIYIDFKRMEFFWTTFCDINLKRN